MLFFLTMVLQIAIVRTQINLMRNWDFESHPQYTYNSTCAPCVLGHYYLVYVNGNTYDWYDILYNTLQFRQKRIYTTTVTSVIDLCASTVSQICQINAFQQALYEIKFTICKNEFMACSYYSFFIGASTIFQNKSICSDLCIQHIHEIRFNSTGNINLCIKGQKDPSTSSCAYGALLDNVTAIKIQEKNTTIQMSIPALNQATANLIITTNLSLSSSSGNEPFTCSYFISLIQSLTINGVIESTAHFYCSSMNSLEISMAYPSYSTINNASLSFTNPKIDYTQYYFQSTYIIEPIISNTSTNVTSNDTQSNGNQNVTQNVNQNSNSSELVYWLNQINQPLALRLGNFFKIGKLMGIGYELFSVFTFWEIAIYFNYIFITTPDFVKQSMQQIFKNFMTFGIFQQMQIDQQVYSPFILPISEKIPPTNDQWLWFGQLGFTSNFYINNVQCVFLLFIGLLKSFLMHLVYLLTGWKYFKMKEFWFGNFAMDLISWVPFLALAPCIMLYNWSMQNFADKINFILNILVLFMCAIISFIFLFMKFQAINRAEKRTKNKKIAKFTKNQTVFYFMDFMFVVFLTFCTGISSKNGFILFAFSMIITKTWFLIKNRKYFFKIDLFFKLGIQIIWFVYCMAFVFFRIIEQMNNISAIDSGNAFWTKFSEIAGVVSIFVFTLGCWVELIHLMLTFFFEIKDAFVHFYKYLKQKCGNKPDAQKEEKKDEKKQVDQISQKKTIKINILEEQLKKQPKKFNLKNKNQSHTEYTKKCIIMKGYSGQRKQNKNALHVNPTNKQKMTSQPQVKKKIFKFQDLTIE